MERGYASVNYYEFSSGDKSSREKSRAGADMVMAPMEMISTAVSATFQEGSDRALSSGRSLAICYNVREDVQKAQKMTCPESFLKRLSLWAYGFLIRVKVVNNEEKRAVVFKIGNNLALGKQEYIKIHSHALPS